MAIAQVFTWNPRPGALEQFIGIAKRADKIIRGLGGSTRTLASVAGATPNAILYIVETPNWKAHAELSTKMETDTDWQKLMTEVNSTDKPTADLVSSAVYSEIPIG